MSEFGAIPCRCGREWCKNEMKVRPVKINDEWSIMLHIACPEQWGTREVHTVCLNRNDREFLIECLIAPEQFEKTRP